MSAHQTGITQDIPRQARYLFFSLLPDASPGDAIEQLAREVDGERLVVGFGPSLLQALDIEVEGMTDFPVYSSAGLDLPSTPCALWCWLRNDDRGELVHATLKLMDILGDAFDLIDVVDAFQYGDSRDLTGYEDGTENPQGDEALAVALTDGSGSLPEGGSFVAVQKWVHQMDYFQSLTRDDQDNIIGRRKSDNEEIDDAPQSAHVKRTAQESFSPEAFVLRRSMPWSNGYEQGLMFVAFGSSFAAFDALLRRMVGEEDGVVDALFRFTRPVSGAKFWCPPLAFFRDVS